MAQLSLSVVTTQTMITLLLLSATSINAQSSARRGRLMRPSEIAFAAATGRLSCNNTYAFDGYNYKNEIATSQYCLCPEQRPRCVGDMCVTATFPGTDSGSSGARSLDGYYKGCYLCKCIDDRQATSEEAPAEAQWEFCTVEGQPCTCHGLVRYGSKKEGYAVSVVDGSVGCSETFLRAPGAIGHVAPSADSVDDAPIKTRECHCRNSFPSGELSQSPASSLWKHDGAPRLLIMTVATHREPFIDLVESSVEQLGANHHLHVVGVGDTFTGYGWKLQQVRKYLVRHRNDYDFVLFMDSFDTYAFASAEEIVDKFLTFQAPMVVSGEVNIWPNPHLAAFMPPSSQTGHYKYPNSGTYMAYMDYIVDLYSTVIAIQAKSVCTDDQGELIKILAKNASVFAIDHQAALFQTLFGSAKDDLVVRDNRPFNTATGTRPCIVHANGWDKGPLLQLAADSHRLVGADLASARSRKTNLEKTRALQTREKDINTRCRLHNPNPALAPEENVIAMYKLNDKYAMLKKRLQDAGTPWDVVEQQTWEVQEYLGFCPIQSAHDGQDALTGSNVMVTPANFDQDGFKVFLYPSNSNSDGKMSHVYRAVRDAIGRLPYITRDPSEAALLIPDVDVSCWCESCLGSRKFETMPPESSYMTEALRALDHWNGGRNHLLFEFSDAPCMPFDVGHAAIASVGLSTFHHRQGLDVAMPLFAMVEFNHSVRTVPANARPILLSFRGTRSPRSDQTRKHLWKLHNGKDIIVPCACRWFDPEKPDAQGYDERCAQDEVEFQKQTYTHLMANSKFSLIVEGFGYHSFRLTEVLAAGAIPVIAIDHYVLPYAMLLDWDSFSIRVPEYQLMQLPEILRAIPTARVERMQQRAAEVYELFFASLSLQVATAVEEIRLVHFVPAHRQAQERRQLLTHGLDYAEAVSQPTPAAVQHASMFCNAPAHRRKNAKDGAVMR